MTSQSTTTTNDAGFTLLELLVSLALLVLIATFLFSSFGFGRRVWQVSSSVEEKASVDTARNYLRRRLSQAAHLVRHDTQSGETAVFEGRPTKLTFVADTSDQLRTGGLYEVTITLNEVSQDSREGAVLRVGERMFRSETAGGVTQDEGSTSELLHGLEGMEFGYYGNPTFKNEADRWHDEWINAVRLPKLVAIRVRFDRQQANRRSWPEFLVALKLAEVR